MGPGARIHGTLPLVRGLDGTYRFWAPNDSGEGEPVKVPADLPDAEITLRVFPDIPHRKGYVAALREHGGNAIDTVASPDGFLPPVLLVIRHDRRLVHGDDLDGSIALVGEIPGLERAYSKTIDYQASLRRSAEEGDRNRTAWASVSRVVSRHGVFIMDMTSEHVDFLPRDARRLCRLSRKDEGYHLAWQPILLNLADDLKGEWDDHLARLGLRFTSGGYLGYDLPELTDEQFTRAVDVQREVESIQSRFGETMRRRETVARFAANPAVVKLLSRMLAGFPVLMGHRGGTAAQISPRSLKAQGVAGTLVWDLHRKGLLDPVWINEGGRAKGLSVFWLTDAGKALAEGRHADATEGVVLMAGPTPPSSASFEEAMQGIVEDLAPGVLDALDEVFEAAPGESGMPGCLNYDAWGAIVLGAMLGRVHLDLRSDRVVTHDGPRANGP